MNFVDWLRATSEWMRKDRPDLYETNTHAFNQLEAACNTLTVTGSFTLSFGSYLLTRFEEDGVIEWGLSKRISSCDIFIDESETHVYAHTANSVAVEIEPELPDISGDDYLD